MLAEIQDALDAAGMVSLFPGHPHMCEVEGETAGARGHSPTMRATPAFHRDCAACCIAVHASAMRRPTVLLRRIGDSAAPITAREQINERILAVGLPLPLVPEPAP